MEQIQVPLHCSKIHHASSDCFAYVLDDVISDDICNKWISDASPRLQYITQAKHAVKNKKQPNSKTKENQHANENENEFIMIDLLNPRKYRLALLHDPIATSQLWKALAPRIQHPLSLFLVREGISPEDCTGLNPRLRVLHYSSTASDRFEPHYDQMIIDDNEWSHITVLLYLNDDFNDGKTWFLNPKDVEQDEQGRFLNGVGITPKKGRVVLFEHELYHSGARVTTGSKYILRTEIMFKKKKTELKKQELIEKKQNMHDLLIALHLEHIGESLEEVTGLSCASATVDSMKSVGVTLLTALLSETSIDTNEQQQVLDAVFISS